jgi:FkbM family methyltransferase
MSLLARLVRLVVLLGMRGALTYITTHPRAPFRSRRRRTYVLRSRDAKHPLLCRPDTSDRDAFAQIFIRREYAWLGSSEMVKTIVDGGANVGYATAYFLSRFPCAHVIAIEPDERNFEILKDNARSYGDRATLLHSAIWARKVGLTVRKGQDRDGREWATTVHECSVEELPDIAATDIGSLMKEFNIEFIDILKLDIEGSEKIVFSENYECWIDKVGVIMIELHSKECSDAFLKALGTREFVLHSSGELVVAERKGIPDAGDRA